MASKPTDAATRALDRTGVLADRPRRTLDVRAAGPPKPLTETLETLADLDDEVVLIQRNDRAPRHLYPKLGDRGYEYETIEDGEEVVTAIWRPEA